MDAGWPRLAAASSSCHNAKKKMEAVLWMCAQTSLMNGPQPIAAVHFVVRTAMHTGSQLTKLCVFFLACEDCDRGRFDERFLVRVFFESEISLHTQFHSFGPRIS